MDPEILMLLKSLKEGGNMGLVAFLVMAIVWAERRIRKPFLAELRRMRVYGATLNAIARRLNVSDLDVARELHRHAPELVDGDQVLDQDLAALLRTPPPPTSAAPAPSAAPPTPAIAPAPSSTRAA